MPDCILGVLGGLGPMSSVRFYEMLTEHTSADCDQEHLNILLSSRADTPDRTAFILGQSQNSPLPVMIREAQRLEAAGATLLALPCNTAHTFYRAIADAIAIPLLNIIDENAEFCRFLGLKKVGVLATEGTAASGAYRDALCARGIDYVTCDADGQRVISDIIYREVKRGLPPDTNAFLAVAQDLFDRGCERIILGCTELSLVCRALRDARFVDSVEILCAAAILACHKTPVGFDADLMRYAAAHSTDTKGIPTCCFPN